MAAVTGHRARKIEFVTVSIIYLFVGVCASDFLLLIISSSFWEPGKWRCVYVCNECGLLLP